MLKGWRLPELITELWARLACGYETPEGFLSPRGLLVFLR